MDTPPTKKKPPSAYGALHARNILIRHQLMEKKRFDSADYNLGYYDKVDAQAAKSGEAQLTLDARTKIVDDPPTLTCLSPGSVGATIFFEGMTGQSDSPKHAERQAPPVQPLSNVKGPATPKTESKYGKLGVANLLIRRKLNRKYFDSADYSMSQQDHEQEQPTTPNAIESTIPPPAPVFGQSTDTPANLSAEMAQKLLARKKIQQVPVHFDSGDFFMNKAHHQDEGRVPPMATTGAKIYPGHIASATTPTPADQQSTPAPKSRPKPSEYGQLCARNILIRKKLAEKKRFDSADYFRGDTATGDASPRGHPFDGKSSKSVSFSDQKPEHCEEVRTVANTISGV